MKKFSNLFNGIKVMTFAAFAGMSAVFGLSSCQDDYFEDQPNLPAPAAQDKSIDDANDNDSVFVSDFVYDNYGISSPDQYVSPVGYNVGSNAQSRAGVENFACKLISFTASKISAYTGNPGAFAVEFAVNTLLNSGEDPVMTELKELNNNVDSLTKLTNKLTSFVKDSKYSEIFRKQRLTVSVLQSMNCTYFNSYYDYIKQGNMDAAKSVLNQWAEEKAGDFKAPYAVKQFLESTVMPYSTDGTNITDIYDYWVFNTTPWEHEGYDKREALRCGDIVVGFTGYVLARAYFEQGGLVSHTGTIKELDSHFNDFLSFYKDKTKVERHDDRIVCQIKGANIVFDKGIFIHDMFNHPWVTKKYDRLAQFMYFVSRPEAVPVFLERHLSSKEAEVIFNYYNPKDSNGKYKNGTVKTMEQIMTDAGFYLGGLNSDKKHVMTLKDGSCRKESESLFNRNYEFYYKKVSIINQENLFTNDFMVGVMWQAQKNNTWEIFHWHKYTAGDSQFFHTNILKRYENMKPF